jgi:hypothetical protein
VKYNRQPSDVVALLERLADRYGDPVVVSIRDLARRGEPILNCCCVLLEVLITERGFTSAATSLARAAHDRILRDLHRDDKPEGGT